MIQHLGDDAALYALGMLDDAEREACDLHASACPACAALLGQACDDVTAMIEIDGVSVAPAQAPVPAPLRRTSNAAFWPALAAVVLLALLPASILYQQNAAMHAQVAQDDAMVARLASADRRVAAFGPMPGGHSAAVTYGPTGSWYVVTVKGAQRPMQVAWMHDGERTMLGTTRPAGEIAMLYLPKSHRMDKLALMDGDTVVAEANLAY
jgi:anti-sigma factor RsiW